LPPQLDALLQKIQSATARSTDVNLGATVAALLVEVGEALKRGDTPDRILAFVERRLGRRLTQADEVDDRQRRVSVTVPEMPASADKAGKPATKVAAAPYRAQPAPARESVPALAPDVLAGSTWNKLVVRFLDGRLLKGYSQDFHPSRPHFHLCTDIAAKEKPVLVPMPHLKAVFFVRCFDGNPDFVESREFEGKQPGRRIEVTFLDDEVLVGTTLGYRPDGTGFFVSPADRQGNNLRVFVLPSAVRHIRYL
jgi:hypothetical protein